MRIPRKKKKKKEVPRKRLVPNLQHENVFLEGTHSGPSKKTCPEKEHYGAHGRTSLSRWGGASDFGEYQRGIISKLFTMIHRGRLLDRGPHIRNFMPKSRGRVLCNAIQSRGKKGAVCENNTEEGGKKLTARR